MNSDVNDNTAQTRRNDQASDVAALRTLNDLNTRLWRMPSLQEGLKEMLVATIQMAGAQRGNIQLLDPEREVLTIEAQSGFERPFLDFFHEVAAVDDSSCGRALRSGEPIVVEDIETDLSYAPIRGIARAAGYRSVQSTPLIGHDGTPLGMISTHWRDPHRPGRQEMNVLARYAQQAAHFIERRRAETTRCENEQRQLFQIKLSDALRPLADVKAIKATAMRLLGLQLNANRVAYFEVTDDAYVVEGDYADGVPNRPGRHPIAAFGSKLYETYRSGHTACASDTAVDPTLSAAERAGFAAMQTRAYIGLPLVKNGAFIAGLAIHSANARDWTPAEVTLAGEVAERTWAAVERARAERSLIESEQKYHTLFDAMDEGYCIIEVLFGAANQPFDWRFIEVNSAFEKHNGVVAATGKTVLELIPDIEPKWFELYGHVARTGEALRTVEQSAAMSRWFNLYAFRVGTPEKHRVAVLFSEYTEGKQAEQASNQLAAIVASSDAAIISEDLDGTMQTWNAGAERLFGYTAEEAVGQSVTMLMPPDHVYEEKGILERIRRGGHIDHFETVRRRRDGTLLDVSLAISPIIDSHGIIVGASKIARDITERRRRERLQEHNTEELRESDARQRSQKEAFKLAIDEAPLTESLDILLRNAITQIPGQPRAAFYLTDDDGAHLHPLNVKSGMAEAYTKQVDGLDIGPDSLPCGLAAYTGQPILTADVFEDPQWVHMRHLAAEHDFRGCWLFPIHTSASLVVGTVALYHQQPREATQHDMTVVDAVTQAAAIIISRHQETEKRQRAEQGLRVADRRKDEFLATLAHELRNPLTPLRNGLEIMRQDDPEAVEKARVLMTGQLTRITHLVDDLMDVSRVTHRKVTLRMAATDLVAIIQGAVENARAQVDAAGHTLRVALPAESVVLQADPDRLTQVFTNLLNNAIQYTPKGGRIEIAVERQNNAAVVTVRDNGMGIAPERLGDVFDLFTQLDPPAGQTNEGLGIGLTLVKQMVELHGGTVKARSEGIGCGAEFTVRLPLAADEPVQLTEDQPAPAAACQRRLLIVDDDHAVADALALMVECWGHEVRIARDGFEALDELPVFQPDTVLLDIGMPRLDGLETAKRMRATPKGQDITLIALTGWGQPEDRSRTEAAGFDHHLVKPVAPDVLEQLLLEPKE